MLFSFVVILAIAYFIFMDDINYFVKKQSKNIPFVGGGSSGQLDKNKLLQNGVSGAEVEALQSMLIEDGQLLPQYGVDGDFGNETEAALFKQTGLMSISLKNYEANRAASNTGIAGVNNFGEALPTKQSLANQVIQHKYSSVYN